MHTIDISEEGLSHLPEGLSEFTDLDENAIMIPANAKMNKMGKAPKDLPYATSLKKLYGEGWKIEEIFHDSIDKGGSSMMKGLSGSSKNRTVFIMTRETE